MFDIHLAWSPIEYAVGMGLLVIAMIAFAIERSPLPWLSRRTGPWFLPLWFIVLVLTNIAAWDVGTRQVDLHRSQFNTGPVKIEDVEKVEVERLT